MKLFSVVRNSLFVFAALSLLAAPRAFAQSQGPSQASAAPPALAQSSAVPSRITEAVDETQLVRLKGNVHPLARPEFDQGPVPDSTTVKRALLLLQRSTDQEIALRKLLDDQQLKDSPNYHKWLTPDQFGAQFGPSDSDIQAITNWLGNHGFREIKVGPGRTTIEFSGSVGQVRGAFHTDIRQFMVNGQAHLANVSEAQVPAAIAPVISGVYGLHNFRPKSLHRRLENLHVQGSTKNGKEVTFTCGGAPCYGVAPADFAKIYNIPSAVKGVAPGTNVTIAIVQDSNLFVSDVQQFRALFGLPANFTAANVVLNGPDPGVQDPTTISGDEMEADLDAELAGAIAPGATVNVVVSETSQSLGAPGIDLSALYIIDNNIAPIMSESFGSCETATVEAFYSALWEQAASQGITVVVATGDSGSDICDSFTGLDYATTGLSVSPIASTPFNVALGGTDFSYGGTPSTYWGAGTTTESAKSYIPESTWNISCAASATSATLNTACPPATINANTASGNLVDIAGGGGGQSAVAANTRPSWQTGITPPADAHRDIPDVSLYSAINSNSNTFIIMCEADNPFGQNGSACAISPSVSLTAVGGTSAAAPAFAGIMAMVVQQQGGEPAGRQGNANHVLYSLYNQNKSNATKVCPSTAANVSTGTCIFYDVVTGNNSVACQASTVSALHCSSSNAATYPYGVLVDPASPTTPAFTAVAGYDKATGLGSVNVTNLLASWSSGGQSADTVTVTSPQGGTTITHGQTASFTIKVAQNSGATVPTGDVSLLVTPSGGQPFAIGTFNNNLNPASTFTLNASGTLTFSTDLLPGGNDSIVAQYGGDSSFAPNQSSSINITVNQESSVTTISLLTFDNSNGRFDLPLTTSAVYGTTPYIMRVDVSNSGGINNSCTLAASVVPCPTGTITETYDSGKPLNDFPNTQTGVTSNTATLNSLGFLEDQPINLPGGSHTIVAAYSGDSSFKASTSSPPTAITVTAAPTATSVAANPASGVNTSTVVTLTATVATSSSGAGPTGSVTFSANGTALGAPVAVVPTAASGLNTNTPVAAFSTASMTHTFTTANTYTISASYSTGDANYSGSSSSGAGNATVTVTSSSTGNFTVSGAAVTVTAGMSGMSSITVTPSGGFTGTVNVTCGSIPGVTCTPNPLAINIVSATAVASNLTVAVAAPSSTTTASIAPVDRPVYFAGLLPTAGGKGWWTLSGATGIAALLLLTLPGKKRYRAAFALGLVCVLSLTLGCGGGYGGCTGPACGGNGTTTTHLTVSSTKVPATGTLTVSASVTTTGSSALTGSVQFYDGATALGSPVPLSSGSTGQINLTAAQAPAFFQLIGTHTAVSAKYLGDAYNSASSSGNLSITITGTTNLPITGASGSSNANANVSLTIN